MAEFVAAIPRSEDNTITTTRLAIEARSHLIRMADDEGIAFDREARGILHIYHDKTEFDAAGRTTELLARGGLERRPVTPAEIKHIEPTLVGNVYGGFYTETDFTGDIHKFTHGLAAACVRRGVTMCFETEVIGIDPGEAEVDVVHRSTTPRAGDERPMTERSVFDRVVICGGVRSREIAMRLGDRVNVYPVKGYSITVNLDDAADQQAAPWTSLLDDRAKIVTSRLGRKRFRVAGTAEFNGFNKDIRADRIEPLVRWCRTHFPGMSTRHAVPWAGLRPMMPDMLPRVMQGRNPRVFYNTGHGHLGWTLSAATADAVGALVTARAN